MEWLNNLLQGSSVASNILLLSLVAASGIALGTIRIFGISLGIAGVLFTGLLFGHFGFHIEPQVLSFAQDFGLILFVYTIGLQVGPGFLNSLRREGLPLNAMAAGIVLSGAGLAILLAKLFHVQIPVAVGLFSGATTNTPCLAAAGEALRDIPGMNAEIAKLPGLGYAIAYPFGVIGIIVAMILIRVIFRLNIGREGRVLTRLRRRGVDKIIRMSIEVRNSNLIGMPLGQIPLLRQSTLVVSRIWHAGKVQVAEPDIRLAEGDVLLAVGTASLLDELQLIVGCKSDLDLRNMTSEITGRRLIVTKKKVLGKTVGELGMFHRHGARITRISRADIELTPTPDFKLQFGDSVLVVGDPADIAKVADELGNSAKSLNHTEVIPLFVGIALGVILGSVPLTMPGIPAPVKLGLAGGPLLVAIILSSLGRVGPLVYYMPLSANFIMREVGIILFLSCVGLKSGDRFVETLVEGDGLTWMALGAVITLVPLMVFGLIARLCLRTNYLSICGLLAGSMTDPPALAFARSISDSEAPSIAYATVYPLTMILRVVCAQLLVIFFMH